MQKRSGGHILIESLRAHGVKKIFCVPGESYLDALNALADVNDIRTITCRQEGGAAFMAEAYAKLTGKTGICFVTRGPGACNASIGVHTAKQDSTPMILLVGQVARYMEGREAFQEVDYREMFGDVAKWVVQIEKAEDVPKEMQRAFEVAHEGRPGPVVVSLPEDMLTEESDIIVPPVEPLAHFGPTKAQIDSFKEILSGAEKPLVILGGGWTDETMQAFEAFCERENLPVSVTFRRQDMFTNSHDCYVGPLGTSAPPSLVEGVKEADVIIALGTRLGEIPTRGYTIVEAPQPKQKFIHIYPEATELNKVYTSDLAINASSAEFVKALSDVDLSGDWQDWTKKLRDGFVKWTKIESRDKYTVDVDGVVEDLLSVLPEDAIITTDAGNFSSWAQRHVSYDRPRRLLAPTSGAMGYGVPSAVAASIAMPDRTVISFAGDGGFMMTGQELATVMHEGAKPIFLVFNNGIYGTIRMHQERDYPGRISATNLTNPDFSALAKSYGMAGYAIEKTEEFLPVFKEALASGKPALIEIRMSAEQIAAGRKMSEL